MSLHYLVKLEMLIGIGYLYVVIAAAIRQ